MRTSVWVVGLATGSVLDCLLNNGNFLVRQPVQVLKELVNKLAGPLNLRFNLLSAGHSLLITRQALPDVGSREQRQRPQTADERISLDSSLTKAHKTIGFVDGRGHEGLGQVGLSTGHVRNSEGRKRVGLVGVLAAGFVAGGEVDGDRRV